MSELTTLGTFIKDYGSISFLVLTLIALVYVFKLYLAMADRFSAMVEKVYPTMTLLEDRLREVDNSMTEMNKLIQWCQSKTGLK